MLQIETHPAPGYEIKGNALCFDDIQQVIHPATLSSMT